jgi:hypothetical protein
MAVTDETCIAKIYAGRIGSKPMEIARFNRWRGSFATFTAIRRASDLILIKVPIGQPCLKGRRPFSLTTDF